MAQSKKTSRRAAAADKSAAATTAATTTAATTTAAATEAAATEVVADIATPPRPESIAEPVVAAAMPAEAALPSSVLQLGSSLSIREVGEYAAQIKSLLAVGPTDVDASGLESIDTAGMQLLLVAAVAAQRRGFKLRLLNAQGVKVGAARALGLNEHLVELTELVP